MKNVGIIFAMYDEFAPVCQALGECFATEGTESFYVSTYKAQDKTIYVAVSGVGEIRAAAATQLLITKYNAECILNFGVAGGLVESVKTFDTVLVDTVVQADFDISASGSYVKGQLAGFASPYIQTDRTLLERASSLAGFPLVTCASADRFVDTREEREALNKEFGAQICEMEAAGIQVTAMLNGIPALFVKTISDSVGGGATEYVSSADKAVTAYRDLFVKLIKAL